MSVPGENTRAREEQGFQNGKKTFPNKTYPACTAETQACHSALNNQKYQTKLNYKSNLLWTVAYLPSESRLRDPGASVQSLSWGSQFGERAPCPGTGCEQSRPLRVERNLSPYRKRDTPRSPSGSYGSAHSAPAVGSPPKGGGVTWRKER